MALVITFALAIFSITALIGAPFLGWLLALTVKPIVDIGWSFRLFGFSPLDIMGAGVPALAIFRMVVFPSDRPRRPPLAGIWLAYGVTIVIGTMIYALRNDYMAAVSFLFRALNGVAAFFALQALVKDRERLRLVVIALLLAGIFPLATGFYEAITGDYWRLRLGSGGQIRIAGMYHNSLNLKYAAYVALTGIALYWTYFSRRQLLMRIVLGGYAFVAAVVIYKIFSKAAFLMVALGFIAWIFMGKRIGWPLLVAVVALAINSAMDDTVFSEVGLTFRKEVMVVEGQANQVTAFGGRLGAWQRQFGNFANADISEQLFGGVDTGEGRSAKGGGHNDYLRALSQTGVLGLVAYVGLLASTGWALFGRYRRQPTPFHLIVLLVFASWMIETMGLTPSLYPHYQWFVWGLVGIALAGVRGLDPVSTRGRGRTPDVGQPADRDAGDEEEEQPGLDLDPRDRPDRPQWA